jgi:hypothetical protein
MTSLNSTSCHIPSHLWMGVVPRYFRTCFACATGMPNLTSLSLTMNDPPCCHACKNCQRPAADEVGLRAVSRDCLLWSTPPLSRVSTHCAHRLSLAGTVAAARMDCEYEPRDGCCSDSSRPFAVELLLVTPVVSLVERCSAATSRAVSIISVPFRVVVALNALLTAVL